MESQRCIYLQQPMLENDPDDTFPSSVSIQYLVALGFVEQQTQLICKAYA